MPPPPGNRHGWKCHQRRSFLHESRTLGRRSDPAVNFPVSSANRRPPENGKMFEIRPPDFLRVAYEKSRISFFFPLPNRVETPPNLLPFFFIWSLKIHKMWLHDYFYTRCL